VFNTRVGELREQLEAERYDRMVSQQATVQVMAKRGRELKGEKRREIERYNGLKRV
jgi:hypothetical protein